jgi:hypothetical protein
MIETILRHAAYAQILQNPTGRKLFHPFFGRSERMRRNRARASLTLTLPKNGRSFTAHSHGTQCGVQGKAVRQRYAPMDERTASATDCENRCTSVSCSASTMTRASGSVPE